MRKIISSALALALMLSLSTTAFASGQGGSKDVTAKYQKSTSEETIYNVDIAWGELTFTYSEKTEKLWDPDTHTYETDTQGGWDRTEAKITVTNHSNTAVDVTMTLQTVPGTGVDVTLIGGSGKLAAGKVGDVDGAASLTGKLTVSGKPNSTVTKAGVKVAEVVVTID